MLRLGIMPTAGGFLDLPCKLDALLSAAAAEMSMIEKARAEQRGQ